MPESLACRRTFAHFSTPQVPQHLQELLEDVSTRARYDRGANHRPYTFTMDVPVSETDVERLGASLDQSTPSTAANNAAFIGGGYVDAATVLAMGDSAERRRAVHKLAPMKLLDSQRVARTPMTKILSHQRRWLPYRQRLPVYQCRGPILDALLKTQVLALVAPPGSGRTLQLPQIILGNGSFNSKRLIVVCPTSLAACRTAARLREERGDDAASATVAVCTSMQYDVTEGTLIAVTTPEMLVRQLLCDPLLLNVCCVILNDIHIRSPITELCMSYLRNLLRLLKEEKDMEKRFGPLRVVVDCLEDSIATSISKFFGNDITTCLNLQQVLQQDLTVSAAGASQFSGGWCSPSVLFLEETIQWLERCETEGSFLCRDPVRDLQNYVENISVQAKILAAGDADFTNDEKLRNYWCPIIVRAVQEYDRAERQQSALNTEQQQQQQQLSSIVVVVPNAHSASVIMETLRDSVEKIVTNEEVVLSSVFEMHVLLDSATAEEVDGVLRREDSARKESRRLVLVTTANVAQLVPSSTLEIGLVVDCARRSYLSYDENTDTDTFVTTYSLLQELHHRRGVARLSRGGGEGEEDSARTPVCMVVQLIPKSILYNNQRRRVRGDSFYHPIFTMSWDEYVRLYHFLQAYEEGVRCRETSAYFSGTENNHVLSLNVGRIVSSNFIDAPPSTSARYEKLRRIFVAVERHLYRVGHLEYTHTDSVPRLLPLGVAATCFSWPLAVVRLLLLSRLEDCVVPASAVGAIWMVGDMFSAGEADEETKQLMKEARVFFSRDSGSDVVSAFNAYCMWLSSRELSAEKEEEFVTEIHIPKEFLLRIESQQLALLHVLETTGVFQPPFALRQSSKKNGDGAALKPTKSAPPNGIAAAVASCVLEMQDGILLDGNSLLRCVTAAAYPQCAVVHNDGIVSSLSFMEDTPEAAAGASASSVSCASLQLSVFSENSLLSVREMYEKYAERPFTYILRSHTVDKKVCILEEATPLSMDGAIVACGEWREWPKSPATRCRGWTSVLTNAWRQTKRARRVPPPAQLPPVSIPLALYDTVQAKQVIVQADDTFFFNMRSTTAKWLRQMRDRSRQQLWALLCDKSLSASDAASFGLREAWEWWSKRAQGAQNWLRERRASHTADTSVHAKDAEATLYPYYHYSTNPGRPTAVVLSNRRADLSTTASFFATGGGGGGGAVPDIAVRQSTAYVGKMPDPVTDKNILEMARSIGKAGSREQETNFLRVYPSLFGFLDPEHEFHGYYLHVLRREAPEMEVLGDNLEELEKFLMQIEEDVRCEIGATTMDAGLSYETQTNAAAAAAADVSATNEQNSKAVYQFQDVNADELKASYGMQIETAAEYAMRPPTLFKMPEAPTTGIMASDGATAAAQPRTEQVGPVASFFTQNSILEDPTTSADIYNTVAEPVAAKETPVDPSASIGNFTFDRGPQTEMSAFGVAEVNDGSNTSANGLTLKERLLAMSGGAHLSLNQTAPTPLLSANLQEATLSSQLPTGNMASTMNVGGLRPATGFASPISLEPNPMASASLMGAAGAGPFFQQAPSVSLNPAELLALMGPNPPPAAAAAANPLTTPPPPLPAEVLANRPPSILVYPLPPRDFGNVPLILAKALGETMGVKVGPTLIVGDIARIDVPNHKVEARALGLKSFMCVGKKVYIFKNDRIFDPSRAAGGQSGATKAKGRDNAPRDLCNAEQNSEKQDDDDRMNGAALLSHEATNVADYTALSYHHYMQFEQQQQQQQKPLSLLDPPLPSKKSGHLPQIGLLTDSEDDDGDEESSNGEESNKTS